MTDTCTYRCYGYKSLDYVDYATSADAYAYYRTHYFSAVYRVYSDGSMVRWL